MIDELTLKLAAGEELSEEEKKTVANRNLRYELVRFLVKEKMNHGKKDGDRILTNFHFTPGPKWEEIPIIDFVNSLLSVQTMDIFDVNGEPNPLYSAPKTGRKKTKLV